MTSDAAPGRAERIAWMIFAPLEFAVTVLLGVLLYLGGALYFAGCIYMTGLSGLVKRASVLIAARFRVGRVCAFANGKMAVPSLSEIASARGGQIRSRSWLN